MTTSITTTSMELIRFYDFATGAVGFLQFLTHMGRHLLPFYPHGQAFVTGVDAHRPRRPQPHDRIPTTAPTGENTPSTPAPTERPNRALIEELDPSLSADLTAPTPTRRASTTADDPPQDDDFLFEHDPAGQLSKSGRKAYDAATAEFTTDLKYYELVQRTFISWTITQMKQNAVDALEAAPAFHDILALPNIAAFRKLLDGLFNRTSNLRSISDFSNLTTHRMQQKETSTEYSTGLRTKVNAFMSTFQSPDHPNHVHIDTLHSSLLLAGLRAEYKPLVDQLIAGTNNISTFTAASLEDRVRTFELDLQAYNSVTKSTTTNPANNPANNRNKNRNTNPTTQALLTPSVQSLWSPTHPHTKSAGNGSGPGDANLPHCPHCAKNLRVYNNHGFPGAAKGPLCHDEERTKAHAAPNSTVAPAPPTSASTQAMLTAALATLLTSQPDHPLDEAAIRALGSSLDGAST